MLYRLHQRNFKEELCNLVLFNTTYFYTSGVKNALHLFSASHALKINYVTRHYEIKEYDFAIFNL